jgi:hypothetical protein
MGWQWIDLTVKFGAPSMFGAPACYVFAQYKQNIIYVGFTPGVGPNGLVHQLRWDENTNNPSWQHKELTSDAGAPRAYFDVRANVHYATGTQHVCYLGLNGQGLLDNRVHDLYADDSNSWSHTNVTTAASGAQPALTTPVGFEFRKLQHIDYQGTDSHVHELWFDSNGWHHNNLTSAPVVSIGPLTARVFGSTATQHIVFRGSGGPHIHELWWDDNGLWRHSDLSAASQAPAANGDPTNYTFEAQGTQHVNYLGTDNHIHELWWNYENGWHHNDLTNAAGAPLGGGRPMGYVLTTDGTQHVVYAGTDHHVHELWWNNSGWHHNDLTATAGAPPAGGDPTGYEFVPNVGQGTQHVIYASERDHHVIELRWKP